eukprot:509022-Hanusia_phi.AAC.2
MTQESPESVPPVRRPADPGRLSGRSRRSAATVPRTHGPGRARPGPSPGDSDSVGPSDCPPWFNGWRPIRPSLSEPGWSHTGRAVRHRSRCRISALNGTVRSVTVQCPGGSSRCRGKEGLPPHGAACLSEATL